jgi:hypothetical protein
MVPGANGKPQECKNNLIKKFGTTWNSIHPSKYNASVWFSAQF